MLERKEKEKRGGATIETVTAWNVLKLVQELTPFNLGQQSTSRRNTEMITPRHIIVKFQIIKLKQTINLKLIEKTHVIFKGVPIEPLPGLSAGLQNSENIKSHISVIFVAWFFFFCLFVGFLFLSTTEKNKFPT